ncbi:MAG: SURF1 family protein [Gammaproteobacteria bacterium]|nr:MAG: SURF1 family protein [Gammaproteobacteria bacterium]
MRIGLLALALCTTVFFAALGMWQLDRAEQKRVLFAEFEGRGRAPEVDLNQRGAADGAALSGYRALATGRYRGATILLDNQVHRGRVGYLVYTAFELRNRKESVLVNRGWVSAGADRRRAPDLATPTVDQRLEGRLSRPPQGGLRLEGRKLIEVLADGILRVQTIDFAVLSATLDVELLPVTVLLDAEAPHGYVRAWTPPGTDETRHLGYAFQWFALAVTVVVVTVVVSLRSGKGGSRP